MSFESGFEWLFHCALLFCLNRELGFGCSPLLENFEIVLPYKKRGTFGEGLLAMVKSSERTRGGWPYAEGGEGSIGY